MLSRQGEVGIYLHVCCGLSCVVDWFTFPACLWISQHVPAISLLLSYVTYWLFSYNDTDRMLVDIQWDSMLPNNKQWGADFFVVGCFTCVPDSLLRHMAQIIALGFDGRVENPCYRRKTPLVVGGTWTQVLADSMVIAASALNHCTTKTPSPRWEKRQLMLN